MLGSMFAKHFAAFMLGWLGIAVIWGACYSLCGSVLLLGQDTGSGLPPFVDDHYKREHKEAGRPSPKL